jgi:hypothetical protein
VHANYLPPSIKKGIKKSFSKKNGSFDLPEVLNGEMKGG